MHLFLHASVRDDKLSVIQNVVTDELVQEFTDLDAKLRRLSVELFQRIGEPVRDLHVLATQFTRQLDVMIPRDAQGGPGLHRAHS